MVRWGFWMDNAVGRGKKRESVETNDHVWEFDEYVY